MLPLLLCLTVACDDPAPVAKAPSAPSPPEVWRLDAVVSNIPGLEHGFPSAGAREAHCPGERPCIVELYEPLGVPEDSAVVQRPVFTRRGTETELRLDETTAIEGATAWPLLGPVLGPCLGDPLSLPPAGDIEGVRVLERDGGQLRWVIRVAGANPCDLRGTLRLPVGGGRVDTSELRVMDHPWDQGGHLRAQERRQAYRRLLVRERWNELSPADKLLAIKGLSEDRDPEADRLLRAIIERDPEASADATRALEHRQSQLAQEHP